MRAATSIRAAVAALALAFAAVACQDDATPTKLADQTREPTETTGINPWAAIFAAAESRGGPVQISFAGGGESYRLGKLDGRWRPENDALETATVCAIDDVANRRELDAFRLCMSQMLRRDACRSGGVFVLYRPDAAPNGWRAACPVEREEDDEREDESRENDPA